MAIIGITGGIACGKTAVSDYLKFLGHPILDADEEVKFLYEEEETKAFILDRFGTLDKLELRKIIFNDTQKKKLLEHHLHPRVYHNILLKIKEHKINQPKKHLFVVIPLLFESRNLYPFDRVCSVLCTPELQVTRIVQRDNNDETLAKQIIQNQLPLAYKQTQSDDVLRNDGSLEELKQAVDQWLLKLR